MGRTVLIDGVRYVPEAHIRSAPLDAARAVQAAAVAVYLYDPHDKANRSALWSVLRALAPDVAQLAEMDPQAAADAADQHLRRAEADFV